MQAGTIQTVAQQHVAGLQMLHQFDIEHAAFVGAVGTERKLLQRTAAQNEPPRRKRRGLEFGSF